ncbi:uncharacterized protein CEXT_203971 [Caerostris extrusa]|uniref:Uncharacterized protein n=1 Tax=Caerostris extrusa TaxID=172846 RepID=A0AAV4UES2_CAEEX|nr:uncharacterized protein CEXT_203971 [Caerostris extrusa]
MTLTENNIEIVDVPISNKETDCSTEFAVFSDTIAKKGKSARNKTKKDFSFSNVDAVIDEVANSSPISIIKQTVEAIETTDKTFNDEQISVSNILPKCTKRKTKNRVPSSEGTKTVNFSNLSSKEAPDAVVQKVKNLGCKQNQSLKKSMKSKKNCNEVCEITENSEDNSSMLPISPINSKPESNQVKDSAPSIPRKRKSQPKKSKTVVEQSTVILSPDCKNDENLCFPISSKKTNKRKPVSTSKKESSVIECISNKSFEKSSNTVSNKQKSLESISKEQKTEMNKKSNAKVNGDSLLKKVSANNGISLEPIIKINKSKSPCKKSGKQETCSKNKSKKLSRSKDEFLHIEKIKNCSVDKKLKTSVITEKLSCIETKEPVHDNFIENTHFVSKAAKKEVKKTKIEEEKENFGVRKVDKIPSGKQKSKICKEGKSSSVKVLSEETKKSLMSLDITSEIELPQRESERDDALSSLSHNEEAADAYSDACGSSGLDRHSSMEIKPLKRKKNMKAKYADDPSFIADLDDLAKLLKSCYITKRQVKLNNLLLPTIFQLRQYMKRKNDKTSRFMQVIKNKVPKVKTSVVKKKPKRISKAKATQKTMPNQKPKITVNENCLPLKKRRHITPNQVQAPKPSAPEPPVQKQSLKGDTVLAYRQKRKRLLKEACLQAQKPAKEGTSPEVVVNGQKKKRRFNKTGFVRVKKKKAKPAITGIPKIVDMPAETNGEIIDLTSEDNVLNSIESVVNASTDSQSSRSRRKRKNVAQKCEIEILDLTSGNDDNDVIECTDPKKQKIDDEDDDDELEPKYQQIIPVTEPSSGRRSMMNDPRKTRRKEIHFPKKKFLRAALYSVHYKQDTSVSKKSSNKKSRSREVKEYVPEDHEFGLMPPPIHVGKYLRENVLNINYLLICGGYIKINSLFIMMN